MSAEPDRNNDVDTEVLRAATYPWMSWDAPWNGVSAKLRRSHEHFWALHDEVWSYLRENSLTFTTDEAPDLGHNWFRITAHTSNASTEQISLILGDFLNNLRAALDHTLGVIDPRAGKSSNFPACVSKNSWKSWEAEWIKKGGQPAILDALAPFQPYLALDLDRDPENELLRIVARLNNADKHRVLNTTPITFADASRSVLNLSSDRPIAEYKWTLPQAPLTEPEYEAIQVRVKGTKKANYVDMEGTIRLSISVGKYVDVIGLAHNAMEAVARACIHFHEEG